MKKTLSILLFFVSTSLLFTACSSDDDSGATTSGELVGKWEFFQEGEIVNGQEILEPYEHAAGCSKDNLEFEAGGVFKSNIYYNFQAPCGLYTETGTWTRNGNVITVVSILGGTEEIQILVVDATTLKVRYEDEGYIYIDVLKKVAN